MDEILRALRAVADHQYLIAPERSQAEDLWLDLCNAIEAHTEIG